MAKRKREPIPEPPKAYNYFTCNTCNRGEKMSASEVPGHLQRAHGMSEESSRGGIRTVVMMLDSAKTYQHLYRWEVSGVILTQSAMGIREEDALAAAIDIVGLWR